MREYKFRGKDTLEGKWRYGFLIGNKRGQFFIHESMVGGRDVNPKTVGQFTGLRDKNGVEIYEGDILRVSELTFISSGKLPENLNVVYIYGMFQLFRGNESLFGLHLAYVKDGEVIGNIHDSPELLGVKP